MKKKSLLLLLPLLAACFASCDLKKCYCYEKGQEFEDHVYSDERCSKLSVGGRGCVEVNERLSAAERRALAEDMAHKAGEAETPNP